MFKRNTIKLNVGGVIFESTYETLSKAPYFASMLDRWVDTDNTDDIFIDRDPKGFENVLGTLRDINYPYDPKYLYEFEFYGLSPLTRPSVNENATIPSDANVCRGHSGRTLNVYHFSLEHIKLTDIPFLTFYSKERITDNIISMMDITIGSYYDGGDSCRYNINYFALSFYNLYYHGISLNDMSGNCAIRIPLIQHTKKMYKKKWLARLTFEIEVHFNHTVNDPIIFYDGKANRCFRYITGIHPKLKKYIIVHNCVYKMFNADDNGYWMDTIIYSNKVKDIWCLIQDENGDNIPLTSMILYVNNYETVFTHSILQMQYNFYYNIQSSILRHPSSIKNIKLHFTLLPNYKKISISLCYCYTMDSSNCGL
jgi:hypothetical protein